MYSALYRLVTVILPPQEAALHEAVLRYQHLYNDIRRLPIFMYQ